MEHLALSLDRPLADNIRCAARAKGTTLSAWLAQAAQTSLLLERAAAAIAEFERENGTLTCGELAKAEQMWQG